MGINLAEANKVISGAIAKAEEIGAKMNIAVCDNGGRLVAFQRMDNAMWAGSFGSQGKAMASTKRLRARLDRCNENNAGRVSEPNPQLTAVQLKKAVL